jgi:hypothetical protein
MFCKIGYYELYGLNSDMDKSKIPTGDQHS